MRFMLFTVILSVSSLSCKPRRDVTDLKDDKVKSSATNRTITGSDREFILELASAARITSPFKASPTNLTSFKATIYHKSGAKYLSAGIQGEGNVDPYAVPFVAGAEQLLGLLKSVNAPKIEIQAPEGVVKPVVLRSAEVACVAGETKCTLVANTKDVSRNVLRYTEQGMAGIPDSYKICGFKLEIAGLDQKALEAIAQGAAAPKNKLTIRIGDYDPVNDGLATTTARCPSQVFEGTCTDVYVTQKTRTRTIKCRLNQDSLGYYIKYFAGGYARYAPGSKCWLIASNSSLTFADNQTLRMLGQSCTENADFKADTRTRITENRITLENP